MMGLMNSSATMRSRMTTRNKVTVWPRGEHSSRGLKLSSSNIEPYVHRNEVGRCHNSDEDREEPETSPRFLMYGTNDEQPDKDKTFYPIEVPLGHRKVHNFTAPDETGCMCAEAPN